MKKKLREDKHWSVLWSFEEKKMFCLKTNKLSNIPHVYHHTPGMIRRNDTVEKRQDFFPRWNNIQDGKASVPSLRIASSIFMTHTMGWNVLKSRGPILRVMWSETRSVCVVLSNQGRVFKFCRSHVTLFFIKLRL